MRPAKLLLFSADFDGALIQRQVDKLAALRPDIEWIPVRGVDRVIHVPPPPPGVVVSVESDRDPVEVGRRIADDLSKKRGGAA